MGNVLSLDIGTKMGYCIRGMTHGPSEIDTHGFVFFASDKNKSFDTRYNYFSLWLKDANYYFGPIKTIVYEDVKAHRGTRAAHVYGGFVATLSTFCCLNNIELVPVGVKTIKKHITGNGNADKQKVIEAVRALGYDVHSSDEADAIALMDYFLKRC